MRRALLAAVVLSTLAAASPAQAKKVTTDPNASLSPATEAQWRSDPRLAQKITYQGGYKRLHAIAEELTKQTGVTIRSGSNSQDWHVRDIPLVVCVKDMPLGNLLKTIAGCAHVTFAMEKVANARSDKPVYKLYRTRKQQQEIDAKLNARIAANRKNETWQWDTLAAYADMPDASKDIPQKPDEIDVSVIGIVARMLKHFGPEGRDKLLAGQNLTAEIGKGTSIPALAEFRDYAAKHEGPLAGHGEPGKPKVEIFVPPGVGHEGIGGVYIIFSNMPSPPSYEPGATTATWMLSPSYMAKALASVKKLNLPKEPDAAVFAPFMDDDPFPEAGFVELKPDADWKSPLLREKIKLVLPKITQAPPPPGVVDERGPNASDILVALASASGINIISEDFESHKSGHRYGGLELDRPLSSGETTPATVLKSTYTRAHWQGRWFFDKDRKLIVGWVADWQVTHLGLIPERLFESIKSKMERDGAELDDLIPLVDLDVAQREQWVTDTDIAGGSIKASDVGTLSLQKLYNSLSAENRSIARSDLGLPLAALDPAWTAEMVKQTRKELSAYILDLTVPRKDDAESILSDPKLLPSLTFKITSQPADSDTLNRHNYFATLESPASDGTRTVSRTPLASVAFPVYTPEREAELRKKAESNPVKKK